jgi:HD-GYP domain-containing protein (c-di-GMP phosphodiesterase class II)
MDHALDKSTERTTNGPYGAPTFKQWLEVAVATLLVADCPVLAVWWLRASDAVTSAFAAAALGMALSLLASFAGRVVWETLPGSEDLLFSELMVWGYLNRLRTQRRLGRTLERLGASGSGSDAVLAGVRPGAGVKQLQRLVARMETRDPYLHGHSRRVARHAWTIARRMGLPREEVARIRTAAAIHDVGKVNTPRAILHKAGPLTDEEYRIVKQHPGDGAAMVAALGDPQLAAMVRHHHERLDGAGYPDGLHGEEIPLGSRIIAVADTFDAITSTRPYRAASPHRKALVILKEESGTRLDAAVVRSFCAHYAGRGPLALWSFVAGLPERAISWLASSAASVASVAKVAAVAALVGGAAIGSAGLGVQLIRGQAAPSLASASADRSQAAARPLSAPATLPWSAAPAVERQVAPGRRAPVSHARASAGAAAGSGASAAALAAGQQSASAAGGAGPPLAIAGESAQEPSRGAQASKRTTPPPAANGNAPGTDSRRAGAAPKKRTAKAKKRRGARAKKRTANAKRPTARAKNPRRAGPKKLTARAKNLRRARAKKLTARAKNLRRARAKKLTARAKNRRRAKAKKP